jgi:magnesium-transporting ATPase (P-type)
MSERIIDRRLHHPRLGPALQRVQLPLGDPSAFHRPFGNRWLWGSVALATGLQLAVVELPFLQRAFGTVSLDLAQWGVAIAMASVVLWFGELRKLFLRAIDRRDGSRVPKVRGPEESDA